MTAAERTAARELLLTQRAAIERALWQLDWLDGAAVARPRLRVVVE